MMITAKNMMTLRQASEQSGYTESYLRQLLRAEAIDGGQKIGERMWLIDAKTVEKLANKPYLRGRPKAKFTANSQGK